MWMQGVFMKKLLVKYNNMPVQVRASFWFLVCTFFQKATMVLTTPIFTRLLSVTEYGEYSVYSSWLGIFTVFVSLNLSLGVYVRGLIKFSDEKERFTSSLQSLTLLLILIWTVIYFPCSRYINAFTGLTTTKTLLMFLTIWLTAVFGFWAAEQRVDYKYRKLVIMSILVAVLGQGVGIIFVLIFPDKVTGRIAGTAVVDFIFYIWLFLGHMKKGKVFFNWKYWKYALLFNLPLVPHYLSQTVLNSSDRIMINNLIGEAEAGIYGLGYSIAQVMTLFSTALAQTIEPWLYMKIKERKIENISVVAYPAFAFIASVNIILIAFSPEIVKLFAPREYYQAIWIIPPITMSVFFTFSYLFFAVFEYYFERTKLVAIASCSGAILNIILNYLFIPIFGYYAAGYTTLVCFFIYAIFHYVFMRKICKSKLENRQPFSLKVYLLIVSGFLGVGFVFLLTYNNDIVRYVFIGILVILIILKSKKIIEIIKLFFILGKKNS